MYSAYYILGYGQHAGHIHEFRLCHLNQFRMLQIYLHQSLVNHLCQGVVIAHIQRLDGEQAVVIDLIRLLGSYCL